MKKLSLIAGLAGLATVGGVFAAWTFGSFQVQSDAGSLSGTNVTIDDSGVVTKYKLVSTATTSDFSYGISQNAAHNGVAYTRTSEKGATYDVLLTVEVSGADAYSTIETTYIGVDATVSFSKIDEKKDCLTDLTGAVYQNVATLSKETTVLTIDANHTSASVGFIIGGAAFNENYPITTIEEAEAFIAAIKNTQMTVAYVLTEVDGPVDESETMVYDGNLLSPKIVALDLNASASTKKLIVKNGAQVTVSNGGLLAEVLVEGINSSLTIGSGVVCKEGVTVSDGAQLNVYGTIDGEGAENPKLTVVPSDSESFLSTVNVYTDAVISNLDLIDLTNGGKLVVNGGQIQNAPIKASYSEGHPCVIEILAGSIFDSTPKESSGFTAAINILDQDKDEEGSIDVHIGGATIRSANDVAIKWGLSAGTLVVDGGMIIGGGSFGICVVEPTEGYEALVPAHFIFAQVDDGGYPTGLPLFSAPIPAEYIAAGYTCKDNMNGTWCVTAESPEIELEPEVNSK